MKECGTLIRIDLDFQNAFNSAGHSCLWAILRGLGVPDVDFLEDLYSKSWMKITVGTGCSAPIQLDTGTVQGSVLSPLLFDLFLSHDAQTMPHLQQEERQFGRHNST